MKKLVVLGFIVGSLAYAGDLSNLEATYQGLEQEYNLLMQKEQEKFNEEKKIAEAAKATLAKQQEMYAMLENKVAQLNSVANTRFYKDNYEGLANKYQGLMVKLEKEMAESQEIITKFESLQALKDGKLIINQE